MSARLDPKYTLEEYFDLERSSEEKYEFFDGRVFAMGGVSPEHSQIESNLNVILRLGLRDRGCRVFTSNLRIKVPALPPYRYPDLSVVCDRPEYEEVGGLMMLVNPVVLIEVLSPTTEAFDRGDKFTYYKSIPSFREYLLVAQHRPHVTHFSKSVDGTWTYEEFNDLADAFTLESVGCDIPLVEVYRDIGFPSAVSLPPNT